MPSFSVKIVVLNGSLEYIPKRELDALTSMRMSSDPSPAKKSSQGTVHDASKIPEPVADDVKFLCMIGCALPDFSTE